VKWFSSGESTVGDTTFLIFWSDRNDGKHQYGVAVAVQKNFMAVSFSWTPIKWRLMHARFKHTAGHLSIIVAYAPTQHAGRLAN